MGIVWAFVQPVITVLLYWFVFEKALNAGTQATKEGINIPYVLWLITGLVPWFYFSDALSSVTNTLIDYSCLVKKVVFNISILPAVKIISALFVHLFFCVFMVVIFACYGYFYTGNLAAYCTEVCQKISTWESTYSASWNYDFSLRFLEVCD